MPDRQTVIVGKTHASESALKEGLYFTTTISHSVFREANEKSGGQRKVRAMAEALVNDA